MADWKIVAIDDDPAALSILQKRLSPDDQTFIFTAGNTKDGLSLIEKEKPNVIILDKLTEDNASLTLCKTLKSNESLKSIPILFFTSYREFGFEALAEAAGALRVIPKLDMPELIEAIQRLKDPDAVKVSDTAE